MRVISAVSRSLAIGALLMGVGAVQIHAQQADVAVNVDAVANPRIPAMVVHDGPLPVQPPVQPAAPATGQPKRSPAMIGSKTDAAQADATVVSGRGFDLSRVTTTGNPTYDDLVIKSAQRHSIDPNLVMAVMRQESGFNARAKSYKGATGLMQLMPATARRFGVENIYDPAQNIEGGTRYLRFLLDSFNGDVELALAGYNAGEHAVINSGYRIPQYRETQNYVRSISAKYGKSKAGRVQAIAEPVAPAAMTFASGPTTRFSNNY